MDMRSGKNEEHGLSRCKCVYFFRTEKWNYPMDQATVEIFGKVQGSLYYTMDYFDFCFAVTPDNLEELLGKYTFIKTNNKMDERKRYIGEVVSHFNECTSSRQLFSLCMGENDMDPFEQERRHLIFTTLSLNPDIIFDAEDESKCYGRVNGKKSELNKILRKNLSSEDRFNIYQVLSNEDFAVVIATDNPSVYFKKVLPLLRAQGYVHSYTIQGYGLQFGIDCERVSFKGREQFRDTHLMRARMSKKYWERFEKFPIIDNPVIRIDEKEQLIGKYNVIFKLNDDEFYRVLPEIICKKLGLDLGKYEIEQNVSCVIHTVDDICTYIRQDLFSYINERTLFHCQDDETKVAIFGESHEKSNIENIQDSEFYEKCIKNPKVEIVRKISESAFKEKDLCINSLYRLQQIYESCAAMGRNLYLKPMVLYILQLIELFLRECDKNFESVLKRPKCGPAFAEYMIDGVSALNTMFTICKDKIYDNLQAPNYDVDYTYATEKVLRAYGRILKKFSDSYIEKTKESTSGGNNEYYPLVIPDASQSSTRMKILFTDAAIRENDLWIPRGEDGRSHQSEKRILLIYCPFDSEILRFSQYLPYLTHELGHYLRPKDRKERNKLYAAYVSMFLEMGMTQSFCRIFGYEYSWELFQKRKIPHRDLVRYIAEESKNKIQEIFIEAAQDTLLDLYHDQLRQLISLLFLNVHPLHDQLRESVEKFERMMQESIPSGDYQEVIQSVKKAWEECKNSLERLKVCSERDDMKQQIIDCCNSITKSEEKDEELENYRKSCKKLGQSMTEAEQVWMEKIWRGELEENIIKKIKASDANRKLNFTRAERRNVASAYHELRKEYGENEKEWAKIKGYVSLYNRIVRFNDNFRHMLECIEDAENRLEVTDDIVKVQNQFIDEIHKSTDERLEKIKIYTYPELYRDLGINHGQAGDEEERKRKFRVMWRKMAADEKGHIEELFVSGKYSFREAMADYTMCCVNKWSMQTYLTHIGRELDMVKELNIYRIAIVLLMLQNEGTEQLEMLPEIPGFPSEYRRSVKETVKYLKSSFDGEPMEVINRIKEPINEAADEFRHEMAEWNYMDEDGWKEDDLTQIRFLLDFSYRSKYKVIEDQKSKCPVMEHQERGKLC